MASEKITALIEEVKGLTVLVQISFYASKCTM